MDQATGQPDSQKSLLEEFSEVHGTVLLGMHKELQTLKQELEQRVADRIDSFQGELDAASKQFQQNIRQSDEIAERARIQTEELLHSVAKAASISTGEISAEKSSLLNELEKLRVQVEQQRAALQNEANVAKDQFATIQHDFQSKLSVALSYTSRLNTESHALLKTIKERQKLLNLREQELHRRTKRLLIASAFVVAVTSGLWIWLAMNH